MSTLRVFGGKEAYEAVTRAAAFSTIERVRTTPTHLGFALAF
jgi:hypothetical protein